MAINTRSEESALAARWRRWRPSQEQIVLMVTALLAASFALSLPGFATIGNVLALMRSVSILGILGIAMAVVVIGRGLDLSLVATMAISAAFALKLMQHDWPWPPAVAAGFAVAITIGLVNGFLETARLTGIAVRPLTMLEYGICAAIGCAAGLVMAASTASMNTQIVNSTMIFDVILVVVLGGVSLVGGRGGVLSVLAGTALIGTLLNGMTIMDLNNNVQNIVKGGVLLAAILLDNRLHPRDEETARQGD